MTFAVSVRTHQLVLALTYRPNGGPQDWRDDHGLEDESRVALDGLSNEAASMAILQTPFRRFYQRTSFLDGSGPQEAIFRRYEPA
jgi:hypothetical protein